MPTRLAPRGWWSMRAILVVCLVTRLGFFLLARPWVPACEERVVLRADALGYHRLATTMLECGRFAQGCAERAESIRTPLYPALVAGVYRLCGPHPWAVMLVQIGLELISCWLVWFTLSRALDHRIGLTAAFLYAVNPFLVLYTATLLSETLFLSLLLAMLGAVVAAERAGAARAAVGLAALVGLTAALATLTRPVCQFVPLFLVVYLLARGRRRRARAVAGVLVMLVVFGLAVSPWLWRNQRTFGHRSLSSVGAFVLVLHVAPMEAALRHQDISTVRAALAAEADQLMIDDGLDPATANPFVKARYWRGLARRYMSDKPASFALSTLRGILHAFGNLATSDFARMLGAEPRAIVLKSEPGVLGLARRFIEEKGALQLGLAATLVPFLLVSYLGLAHGLVRAWGRLDRGFLALCLALAAYFILVTGAAGLVRYRLPAVPYCLPFIAVGLLAFYDRLRHRLARGREAV